MANDTRRKLYTALNNAGFDIGSYEDFDRRMNNQADRKKFYDAVSNAGYDIGDYDAFNKRITPSKYSLKIKGVNTPVSEKEYKDFVSKHQGQTAQPAKTQTTAAKQPRTQPAAQAKQAAATAPATQQAPTPMQFPDGFGQFDVFSTTSPNAPQFMKDMEAQSKKDREKSYFGGRSVSEKEKDEQRESLDIFSKSNVEKTKKAMQQRMDEIQYEQETGERMRQPIEMPFESPTLARDEDGNVLYGEDGKPLVGRTTDKDIVNTHQLIKSEQQAYDQKQIDLQDAEKQARNRLREVDERLKTINQARTLEFMDKEKNKSFWDRLLEAFRMPTINGRSPYEDWAMSQRSDEEMNLINSRRTLEYGLSIVDDARKDAGLSEGPWYEKAGKGISRAYGKAVEVASNPETWDFGAGDMEKQFALLRAVIKEDNGEASPSDKKLLDDFAVATFLQGNYEDKLSGWTKAGLVTGESLPFMLEMFANPAAGIGRKASEGLLRYSIKKYGTKYVRDHIKQLTAKKIATRILGDVVAAHTMAATTGAMRTLANTYERMRGDINTGVDENGRIIYDGHEVGESAFDAFSKAWRSTAIENWSEMAGEYLPFMTGFFGNAIGKAAIGKAGREALKITGSLESVGLNKAQRFIYDLAANKGIGAFSKGLDDFLKRTQWHGVLGEYSEEVLGNIANAITVGDMTLDTAEGTGVFNLQQNIDTFNGVALMGGFTSALQTGAFGIDRYRNSVSRRDSEGSKVFGSDWERIKTAIDSSADDARELNNVLTDFLGSGMMDKNQKKAVLNYTSAMLQSKGAEMTQYQPRMQSSKREEVSTPDGKRYIVTSLDKNGDTIDRQTFDSEDEATAFEGELKMKQQWNDLTTYLDMMHKPSMGESDALVNEFLTSEGFDDADDITQSAMLAAINVPSTPFGKRFQQFRIEKTMEKAQASQTAIAAFEEENGWTPGTVKWLAEQDPMELDDEGLQMADKARDFLETLAYPPNEVHVEHEQEKGADVGKAVVEQVVSIEEPIEPLDNQGQLIANQWLAAKNAYDALLEKNEDLAQEIGSRSMLSEQEIVSSLDSFRPEEVQTVIDYFNAKARYEGFMNEASHQIDAVTQRERNRRTFRGTINGEADTSNLIKMVDGDGNQYALVSGNVNADSDGHITGSSSGLVIGVDDLGDLVSLGDKHLTIIPERQSLDEWEANERARLQEQVTATIDPTGALAAGVIPPTESEDTGEGGTEEAPAGEQVAGEDTEGGNAGGEAGAEGTGGNEPPAAAPVTIESVTDEDGVKHYEDGISEEDAVADMIASGDNPIEIADASIAEADEAIKAINDKPTKTRKDLANRKKHENVKKYYEDIKSHYVHTDRADGTSVTQIGNRVIIEKDGKIVYDTAGVYAPIPTADILNPPTGPETPPTPPADETPDVMYDTPAAARERGYIISEGHRIDRQEEKPMPTGKEVEVQYSTKDKVKGHLTVSELGEVQGSHLTNGQRNLKHYFLSEAQPKGEFGSDRQTAAQVNASEENFRPELMLTFNDTQSAYSGSTAQTNRRGEVIQGNGRRNLAEYIYAPGNEAVAKRYKEYLMAHAEELGTTAEEIAKMEKPFAHIVLDVTDEEAIRLGQFTAQDLETGGKKVPDVTTTITKLGDSYGSFANIVLEDADPDASLAERIEGNAERAIKWLNQGGYINDTEAKTLLEDKSLARQFVKDMITDTLFRGASPELRSMFYELPKNIQSAIVSVVGREVTMNQDTTILKDIQESILAFHELMSSSPAFAKAKGRTFEERYNAVTAAVNDWLRQLNIDGSENSKKYSNFALELAKRYKSYTDQKTLRSQLQEYYDLVSGASRQLNMFEEEPVRERLSRDAAIKKVFGINNEENGEQGVVPLAGDDTGSEEGGQGQSGDTESGEQEPEGEQPPVGGRGDTGDAGEGVAQTREEYLASHPLTEAQIMADTEATEDEKLNAIDFLKGEDDSAISRFYYDSIYNRAQKTPSSEKRQKKEEKTAKDSVDNPLESLSEVKKFMDEIGYKGSLSRVMTDNNGKKFVKYQASGNVTPNIVFGETTRRDVYQQFHNYRNVMDVDIPSDVEAEFERADASLKETRDALYASDRDEIKQILTEAGIPFADVIDSERGSRIVFTSKKNENGNYTDWMDVSDPEQAREDIALIKAKAERYKSDPLQAMERAANAFREEQKAKDQQDIDNALDEFNKFLDDAKGSNVLDAFMRKGLEGNDKAQANLLDAFTLTNEAQRMFLKDLLRLASKVGYAYIKSGVHDVQEWSKKMSDGIGRKLKEVLGWDEAIVGEFVDEVWQQKYTVYGQRMRLSEHAERLKNDKGADTAVNVNKKENNEEEKGVTLQEEPAGKTAGTEQQLDLFNLNTEGNEQEVRRDEGLPAEQGSGSESEGQEGGEPERVREGGSSEPNRPLQSGLSDTVEETEAEPQPQEKKNQRNNRNERGKDYAPTSATARVKANIAAIKLLKQLESEDRDATREEMAVLKQYSGWGGLGGAFNENSPYYNEVRDSLDDAEYDSAAMSINSAYYTPASVIDRLWDVATKLGFKGGNILESSAGIGNIIASIPESMNERSDIEMVEIDSISGRILAKLYPDAKVNIKGFEDTRVENGSVDLAITNVPFVTGLKVRDEVDTDLSRQFGNIHDFVIAKNIRKLKEGGIGIFITTSNTLDKSDSLREWIDGKGDTDVMGVFRLNNETFGGTNVTSDIIVVRKRVNGERHPDAIDVKQSSVIRDGEYENQDGKYDWKTGKYETKRTSMRVNNYLNDHPEDMGGEMAFGYEKGDTFRPGSYGLYPSEKNQEQLLDAWVRKMKNVFAAVTRQRTRQEDTDVREGRMFVKDGKIYVSQQGKAVPYAAKKAKVKGKSVEECVKDYVAIRESLSDVLKYQLENESNENLKPLLDKLNKAYDDFVRKYGYLHKNTAISFLRDDIEFPDIAALENYSESKDIEGNKIVKVGKSKVFEGRVLRFKTEPKPQSVKDGVLASVQQFGKIDLGWIAQNVPGQTEASVRAEILNSGYGFEDPVTKKVEVRYEYLSGNVREKLRQARENNTDGRYNKNIEALEKVMPMDIPAHLIDFSLGSSWIDPKLYEDFVKDKYGCTVRLVNVGGVWSMEVLRGEYDEKNRAGGVHSELLGDTIPASKLFEAAINNRTYKVQRTFKEWDGSKRTETDKAATQACQNRIGEIKDEFNEWAKGRMQTDVEMAEKMMRVYNDKFNSMVPKEVDDTFVPEHFEGAVDYIHLYPHQSKAVMRAVTEPVMLAHQVGAGKTFTLITTAMEMRRLGTAKKPMIVVQNATVGQFVAAAKTLYPNAKILSLTERDRDAEGRRSFYGKIKYNDWDMIVIPQSTFERIPDSPERQEEFIQEKIDDKLHALEAARIAKVDDRLVKQMEREIDDLEQERDDIALGREPQKGKKGKKKDEEKTKKNTAARAKEQLDRHADDVMYFDDMGIDALLIDEAHEYKRLGFSTTMGRGVKGIDPAGSKKAAGVYLKTRGILKNNGWKNVVFATGTPISNTAAEIWTFMKYLMPKEVMMEQEIWYFDDFVHNFGKVAQSLEFATNGKFKENTRFAAYINKPELIRIWSTVADTVLAKDMPSVAEKLPEKENGKDQDVFLPQTQSLIGIMRAVRKRLEEFEKMSGAEKRANSSIPLVMYGLAKRAAIDPRLVEAGATDEPNSKTNKAAEEIVKDLASTDSYKGTVAVFCDMQNGPEGFNIFQEMKRKLVEKGVPESKIAIITSGMTITQKEKIFEQVNSGDIRVIMGSTQTLGTGVNIQERLHLLIHMDAPDRPMDYTQRNGRILRQGNLHKEWGRPIRILRFGVEDSLDVTSYQRLKTKSGFIDSIMDGKGALANNQVDRTLEEEEEGLFDNPVAVLSGSQYALKKTQAERELRKWQSKRQQWEADQIYIENTLRRNKGQNKEAEERIKEYDKQIELAKKHFPDGKAKTITIKGVETKTEEELQKALTEQVNKPIRERVDSLRNDRTFTKGTVKIPMKFDDVDVNVEVEIERETEYVQGKGMKTTMHTTYSYTIPALGLSEPSIERGFIKDIINDIKEDITAQTAIDRKESAEKGIEKRKADNEQLEARRSPTFKDEDKLAAAREKVTEYTAKMKEEMAEKEAKYAAMDAEVVDIDAIEDNAVEEDDNSDSSNSGRRFDEDIEEGYTEEEQSIIDDAKKNGTYMRAPNGKRSNLTPKQWVRVRTEAFKKWFGDWENDPANASKVVDENGEPKVVIHGSPENGIHIFDASKRKRAAMGTLNSSLSDRMNFFTDDDVVANAYTGTNGEPGGMYDVFLNIRNPKIVDYQGANWNGDAFKAEYYSRILGGWVPLKTEEGLDYFSTEADIYRTAREKVSHLRNSSLTDKDIRISKVDVVKSTNEEAEKAIKEGNYDGVIFQNVAEAGQGSYGGSLVASDYVTFNSPNQIKSATDNVGTYSSENDDIRFDEDKDATLLQHTEHKQRIAKHIEALAEKLGTRARTTVYHSLSEVPEGLRQYIEEAHKRGRKVRGWYENGEVHLFLPDIDSEYQAEKTIWHETVAHHGLRQLIGEENLNKLLKQLWLTHKDGEMGKWVSERMQKNGWSLSEAIEEYLAREAEKNPFKEPGLWQRLRWMVAEVLHKMGFASDPTISDIQYLFWLSQNRLNENDPMSKMKQQAFLFNLEREAENTPYVNMNAERVEDIYDPEAEGAYDDGVRHSEETDEEVLERLEKEPKIKTYRAMMLIDGKLYPPMATFDSDTKQLPKPTELGKWEKSDEHPEKAIAKTGKNGETTYYFRLQKSPKSGDYVDARYDPYIHTSTTMLNDQFKAAQNRPGLVVVEMEVPESELTSGYKAEKAYLSVGRIPWTAGAIQKQLTGTREVILSRWAKPVRIVPTEEYADHVANLVKGQVEVFPSAIVTPEQRKALEARGIKFVNTNGQLVIQEGEHKGEQYEKVYAKSKKKSSRRYDEDIDDPLTYSAKEVYNDRLNRVETVFSEAYQDAMVSLKTAQNAIAKDQEIPDSQNAYMAENLMHGKTKNEQDTFNKMLRDPLIRTINKILNLTGMNWGDVDRYVYTKSGLERNREFYVRDWLEKEMNKRIRRYEDLNEDEQRIYDQKAAAIEQLFDDGDIDEEEKNKRLKQALQDSHTEYLNDIKREWQFRKSFWDKISFPSYLQSLDEFIRKNIDDEYDPSEHDYSGFRAMFGDENGKYNEDAIIDELMDTEDEINSSDEIAGHTTDTLWEQIRACTRYGLKRYREAGMRSDEQIDAVENMFNFYVPMRGFKESRGEDMYQYFTGKDSSKSYVGGLLKHAKGRGSEASYPISTIFAMTYKAISDCNQNMVNQKLYRLCQANPNDLIVLSDSWAVYNEVEDRWEESCPEIPDDASEEEVRQITLAWEEHMRELAKDGKAKKITGKARFDYKPMDKKKQSEHIVDVRINGQPKKMIVTSNPRMAQALNGQLRFERGKNFFSKLNAAIKNFMSSLFTSYSPTFALRNMFRDWTHFRMMLGVREGHGYAKQASKYYRQSLFKMVGLFKKYREGTLDMSNEMERDFKDFMDNGGVTGYVHMQKIDDIQKEMKKLYKQQKEGKVIRLNNKVWDYTLGAIEAVNEGIENNARFATYRASRHYAGRTRARSAYDAKEITVNFNRKGAGSKSYGFKSQNKRVEDAAKIFGVTSQVLGEGRIFFNATVQAIATTFKNFQHEDGSLNKPYIAKWFGKYALPPFMFGFLLPLMNKMLAAALGGDDDDPYANLPDWTRRKNLCFYIGNDNFITIPIGQELAAFLTLGDIAAGLTYAQELKPVDKGWDDEMLGVMSTFSPVDIETKVTDKDGVAALIPNAAARPFSVLAPIVAVSENISWTGRPIYKEDRYPTDKYKPEYQQVYQSTNPVLVGASKLLHEIGGGDDNARGKDWSEVNPGIVQYLWEQYTGGPGKVFSNAISIGKDAKDLLVNGEAPDFNIRKVEGLKAFVQQGDDRTQYYRTQAKFYKYQEDADKFKHDHDITNLEKQAAKKDGAARLELERLQKTKEYQRYAILKEANRSNKKEGKVGMDDMRKDIKSIEDPKKKRNQQQAYNILMKEVVDMLDDVKAE